MNAAHLESFGTQTQTAEPSDAAASRPTEAPKPKRRRGFAAMDPKLVSEISRKGGKAAHTAGTAHEFTTDEAREAGRKGGRATHAKRRARSEAPPATPEVKSEASATAETSESDQPKQS
jgi:general stress protein YciG